MNTFGHSEFLPSLFGRKTRLDFKYQAAGAESGRIGGRSASLNAGKLCCSRLWQLPRPRPVPLETLPDQLAHFQTQIVTRESEGSQLRERDWHKFARYYDEAGCYLRSASAALNGVGRWSQKSGVEGSGSLLARRPSGGAGNRMQQEPCIEFSPQWLLVVLYQRWMRLHFLHVKKKNGKK